MEADSESGIHFFHNYCLVMKVRIKLALAGLVSIFILSGSQAVSARPVGAEAVNQAPCEAVVGVSAAFLRAAADYESPLETQELMGTVVQVLEKERYWCKVESPQPYTAWCTDRVLVPMSPAQSASYKAAPKYVCIAAVSQVLAEPRVQAQPLCDVVLGCFLRVVFRSGRHSSVGNAGTAMQPELNNGKPLTRGKYAAVLLPDGRQGWMLRSELMGESEWRASGCDLRSAQMRPAASETVALPEKLADADRVRAKLVSYARGFLGVPYFWGGMTPKGFDCSGLVRMVYLRYGLLLPRNASQMARLGREVKADKMQPGDLIFFGLNGRVTHVGMYIGDGHFIHSSHLVRINAMDPQAPDAYENMYKFLFCRNILD